MSFPDIPRVIVAMDTYHKINRVCNASKINECRHKIMFLNLEFHFSYSVNWRNSCCNTIHYLVMIVNYLHCLKLRYCGHTYPFSWEFYLLLSDSLEQIIPDCTWRQLNLFMNKRKNSNKQNIWTKSITDKTTKTLMEQENLKKMSFLQYVINSTNFEFEAKPTNSEVPDGVVPTQTQRLWLATKVLPIKVKLYHTCSNQSADIPVRCDMKLLSIVSPLNMVQTSFGGRCFTDRASLISGLAAWKHDNPADGFLFPLITVFGLELAAALYQLCSGAASVSSSACLSLSLWKKVPVNTSADVFYSARWRTSRLLSMSK